MEATLELANLAGSLLHPRLLSILSREAAVLYMIKDRETFQQAAKLPLFQFNQDADRNLGDWL